LVYVNSDADHCDVCRFVLRAHLHQDAAYFAPEKLNVVRHLNRGLKVPFRANDVGDCFDCPNGEPPGIAEMELWS